MPLARCRVCRSAYYFCFLHCGVVYPTAGARYNPGTNNWTSTSGISPGREFHTAVWNGSEMIVWGGRFYNGSYQDLNSGGRYNPGTNSWTATSTTSAPSARVVHTAVWTGSEMIVWGGAYFDYVSQHDVYLNDGGRHNPGTDSWTATSTTNAPSARWFHTAVWTGSEMIVWGGNNDSSVLNTGGRYCVPTPRPRPTPAPRP